MDNDNLGTFPYSSKINISINPSLIHINGIAGIYETNNESYQDLFDRTEKSDLKAIVENTYFIFDSIEKGKLSFNNTLCFSWEQNQINATALNYAKQFLSESDIIVIIGYSLPDLNRSIDRNIFSGINSKTKIYYQDKVPDEAKCRRQLQLPSEVEIALDDNTLEFLIPEEMGI